jgi:hypothetical protein
MALLGSAILPSEHVFCKLSRDLSTGRCFVANWSAVQVSVQAMAQRKKISWEIMCRVRRVVTSMSLTNPVITVPAGLKMFENRELNENFVWERQ